MTAGPSRAFRRWCAAAILLVVSWSLPGSVYAKVSPMEIVKYQLRKPNFLVVVESAESMQGIPGECHALQRGRRGLREGRSLLPPERPRRPL